MVELGKLYRRDSTVTLRQGGQRYIELRPKVNQSRETAKLQDFSTRGEYRQQLVALYSSGLVRQCRDAPLHTLVPVIQHQKCTSGGQSPQVTEGEGEQPAYLQRGR